MAFCPNKNLPSWKSLVSARGEDMAYYLWNFFEGEVPQEEYLPHADDIKNPLFDETYHPQEELYTDDYSIESVIDGRRNIALVNSVDDDIEEQDRLAMENDIGFLTVKSVDERPGSNFAPVETHIYYNKDHIKQAQALRDVVKKDRYSPEDVAAIGLLLQYDEKEVKKHAGLETEELDKVKERLRKQLKDSKEDPNSAFNTAVLQKVKAFLDRIGVDVRQVTSIKRNGITYNARAMADFTNALIQYTKGNEEYITEDAMHFAVEILEQTNPDLFNSMLSQIGQYEAYKDLLELYGSNPEYQTKDGKPDIRLIKKEAIGRKLADMFIEQTYEDTYLQNNKFLLWWQKVKNFFNDLFTSAGFDPFEEAVARIISDEGIGGTAADIDSEGVMFSLEESPHPKQAIAIARIKGRIVTAVEKGYKVGTDEVRKRVTEIVQEEYDRMFRNRDITKSEYQKMVDDLKLDYGDAIHLDLANLFTKELLHPDGSVRATPLENINYKPKTNNVVYSILRDHFIKKLQALNKKHPDIKFLVETSVARGDNSVGGTIDFMGITAEGKIILFDWKSFDLSTDIYNDVPWYKQRAWRRQLAEYKRILMDSAYGFSDKDFLAESAAIPIKANYKYEIGVNGQYFPKLKSVSIGDADVSTEERDYLLPVPVDQSFTEDPVLNKLLNKLNGLRENLQERLATTAVEKFYKKEQLQLLDKAIRHLVVKNSIDPLLEQASFYTNEIENLFDTYDSMYRDKDFSTFTKAQEDEMDDFALRFHRAFDEIEIYTRLSTDLKPLLETLKGSDEEEYKKKREKINDIVNRANDLRADMDSYARTFADQIAKAEGFDDVNRVEKRSDPLAKNFSFTSKIQQRALQVFYKKRATAQNRMDFDTRDQYDELMKLKENYDILAQSKGWNIKDYFDVLVKKNDQGENTNKLIDQYSSKFYDELKEAIKAKDYKWIKDNVDVAEYEKALEKELKEKITYITESLNYEDTKEGKQRREKALERALLEYNIDTPESLGWYLHYAILRDHPKQTKWESQEWKNLHSSANEVSIDGKTVNPAVDLYNWILKVNELADKSGYIPEGKVKRNFLPFVAKSFTERLTFGGKVGLMDQMIRNMTIDEDTIGYGEIDKVSKRLIRRIPRYFTNPSDKELSTDLFKNLALYAASVNRYKYLSDIEGVGLLLGRIERNKESIQTSLWGKPEKDSFGYFEKIENNDKNADLYDRQLSTLLYDQKYIEGEQFDILLGKAGEMFKKANKFLGFKAFPENLSERQFSMNRLLDTANNYFTQKTLGLNPLSALSNSLGGQGNAIMMAGKFFNKTDLLKSEYEISTKNFSDEYGQKIVAALKYFLPFTDDVNREMLKELSLTKLSSTAIQDALFWMMRTGDKFVQSSLFLSVLRNQVIIDGKVYNAREYLRQQPEYLARYKNPENIRNIELEFDNKVQELIEKYGLLNQAKVEDGKLVIPGVDPQSKDVFKIRNITKDLSVKILGNMTPEQVRGVQQNVYMRSLMVFRNWIPSLVDVRYGGLKYDAASDAYEWGRHRAVARFVSVNGISNIMKLRDAVLGLPEGIEALKKLYDYKVKAYEDATGQPLKMTEEEFYDMVRLHIRQAAKDAIVSLTAFSALTGLILAGTGDDDNLYSRNLLKFSRRALDKLTDEFTFFYNPVSAQQLLNGSIFPSMGIFTDAINVINHTTKELYGFTFDEKLQEKNDVVKYYLKPVPFFSQFAAYLPLYAPEVAEWLGIRMGTQSRLR